MSTSLLDHPFVGPKADLMPTRLRQLQEDFATRQRDSIATGGEVYCTLSCAVTYVDAENDTRAEDTFSRVENTLCNVKKLGGNQLAVIELSDKDDKLLAVTAGG